MSSYLVDVNSNSRLVNGILNVLGGFPQNSCGEKAKMNDSMMCDGRPCDACGEMWGEECDKEVLKSEFKVSKAMVRLGNLFNLQFKVRAWGGIEGEEGERELWCMDFREWKEKEGAEEPFFLIDTKKSYREEDEL